MFYVNQRLQVIPNHFTMPDEFAGLPPEVRVKIRDALSSKPRSYRFIRR